MSRPTSTTPLLPRVGVFPGPGLLWRTGAILGKVLTHTHFGSVVERYGLGQAAAGIVAGAFGSHGLQKRQGITPENLHAWQTASNYAVSVVHLFQDRAHRHLKLRAFASDVAGNNVDRYITG